MSELWKLEMRHLIWTNCGRLVCFISGCQRKNGVHRYKKECEKDIPDHYSLF